MKRNVPDQISKSKKVKFGKTEILDDNREAGTHKYEDAFGFDHRQDFEEEIEKQLEPKRVNSSQRRDFGYIQDLEDSDEGSDAAEDDFDMFSAGNQEEIKPKKKGTGSLPKEELEAEEDFNADEEYTQVKNLVDSELGDEAEAKPVRIIPFNLREEMDEGKFNEEGMYIEATDENRHHDIWMSGIGAKDIESAAKAHEKREQESDKIGRESTFNLPTDTNDLLKLLLEYLNPGENLVGAMKRLGGKKVTRKNAKKSRANQATDPQNKEIIEKLTEIAASLLEKNYLEVYEDRYEKVKQRLIRTGALKPPENPAMSSSPEFWEFKWERSTEKIHGPFSGNMMREWYRQGYFNEQGILVRRATKDRTGDFEAATPSHKVFSNN